MFRGVCVGLGNGIAIVGKQGREEGDVGLKFKKKMKKKLGEEEVR